MSPCFADLPQPFLASEAEAAGLSERRRAGARRRGSLTRLAPGLYAVATTWDGLSPRDRHTDTARAAVRAVPNAVLSHRSAALLHGLPHPWGALGPVRMTVLDDTRTSRAPAWIQLHRGAIPVAHRARHDLVARDGDLSEGSGLLVTSPARTVVDCFREECLGDGVAIGDGALRLGLATPQELAAMRAFQTHWPGVTKAAIGIRLLDRRRANWLESRSAAALWRCGIPLGVPQVVVRDERRRFVARVDMAWSEEGVVGEADGRGKYLGEFEDGLDDSPRSASLRVVAAGARESRLRDLGLEVVRWDPMDIVRAPGGVAERWEAAAARGRGRRVTARLECSCCAVPLTDCAKPTDSPLLARHRGGIRAISREAGWS
jgi:hypothetical protein